MVLDALGSERMSTVQLVMATRCHHTALNALLRLMVEEGTLSRREGPTGVRRGRGYVYWRTSAHG